MLQASLSRTSLSARKPKKPDPVWIVFQKALEHNWTRKILLEVFQSSWYKVVSMDQVIFKYYGRDLARWRDKLRRIAKEHLWRLKRETRHCVSFYIICEGFVVLFIHWLSPLMCMWNNETRFSSFSLTPLHFWTWKMTNLIINIPVSEDEVRTRPRWCSMMVRLDVWYKFMPCVILFTYQFAGISRVRTTLGWS